MTLEECREIYGEEVQMMNDHDPNDKIIFGSTFFNLSPDGYFCHFDKDGKCDHCIVLKIKPSAENFTEDEALQILSDNAGEDGFRWGKETKIEMKDETILYYGDGTRKAFLNTNQRQIYIIKASGYKRLFGKEMVITKDSPKPETTSKEPHEEYKVNFSPEERTHIEAAVKAIVLRDDKTAIESFMNAYQKVRENSADHEEANKRFGPYFFHLAECYDELKQGRMRRLAYERFLEFAEHSNFKFSKESYNATNNLAYLLATHPDPKIRDTKKAAALIPSLIELGGERQYTSLHTIACAYAGVGEFEKAIEFLDLVDSDELSQNMRKIFSEHRQLFVNKKPYIQKAPDEN